MLAALVETDWDALPLGTHNYRMPTHRLSQTYARKIRPADPVTVTASPWLAGPGSSQSGGVAGLAQGGLEAAPVR